MFSNVHGIVLWFRLQLIFYFLEPAFHKVASEVVAQPFYYPAYDVQMRIAVVYAADTIDGGFVVLAVRLYRHYKVLVVMFQISHDHIAADMRCGSGDGSLIHSGTTINDFINKAIKNELKHAAIL